MLGISTLNCAWVALKAKTSGSNTMPMVADEWGWYDGNTLIKTLSFLTAGMDNLDSTGGLCIALSGGASGFYEDIACHGGCYYFCEFVQSGSRNNH